MKTIFESVINRGGYELGGLLKKIDSYHIEGKLTDAQRTELYAQARSAADPGESLDLRTKVLELEQRVRLLEEAGAIPGEEPEAYVPGRWYRLGDRVGFENAVFTCIAPEGVVCTWSPAEYPDFWEKEG